MRSSVWEVHELNSTVSRIERSGDDLSLRSHEHRTAPAPAQPLIDLLGEWSTRMSFLIAAHNFREPINAWSHCLWLLLSIPATVFLWLRSEGDRDASPQWSRENGD
jgi:hypothetical protein